MAFYVELVDAEGVRHWYDVLGGDNVQDALDGAHGLANCDPMLEGDGMTFRAYPLDLSVSPLATLDYDSEVVF